jgi:hypothetical protein
MRFRNELEGEKDTSKIKEGEDKKMRAMTRIRNGRRNK